MDSFDVNRFVKERGASWERLEEMCASASRDGVRALELDGAHELSSLYRAVSSDLVRARSARVDAELLDHLNDLVARSYALIHGGASSNRRRAVDFFVREYPRLLRREWRAVALSAGILAAGSVAGALGVARDPSSLAVLIPETHQQLTPQERVKRDQRGAPAASDEALAFSGWLFTHNLHVSFTVFALGLSFGLGTIVLLFANGVPLGALAMQYQESGLGEFFWAWILPHGILELTVVAIAGGAGLIIARGLWLPRRLRRRDALRLEAGRAAALVLGSMPLLGLAGLIEGTISQVHAPVLPYAAKLAFAALIAGSTFAYLSMAGRSVEEPRAPVR